jgi:antirestriction protein ArdC
MKISALYETVTQNIVKEMEAGVVENTSLAFRVSDTHNSATGRAYSGINIPLLWGASLEKGYASHQWMTFKQAQALGATVRGGERSTSIVFAKQLTVKRQDEEKKVGMLRAYAVFNHDQIDGLTCVTLRLPIRRASSAVFCQTDSIYGQSMLINMEDGDRPRVNARLAIWRATRRAQT